MTHTTSRRPEKLILSLDGQVLREYPLDRARMTIGRRPQNDIVIDGMAVSGEHAVFVTTQDGTIVEDLDSTNGVSVNDEPVMKRVLHNEDVVKIGRHRLMYVNDPQALGVAEGVADSAAPLHADEGSSGATTVLLSSDTTRGQRQALLFAGFAVVFVVAVVGLKMWEKPEELQAPVVVEPQVQAVEAPAEPVAEAAENPAAPTEEKAASDLVEQSEKPVEKKYKRREVVTEAPAEQAADESVQKETAPPPKKAPPAVANPPTQKPSSPKELCVNESNFITRSLCELRVCRQPEWINHPFCVKLHEKQEKNRDRLL